MSELFDAFAGLFSLSGLLSFTGGVILTLAYYRITDILAVHSDPKHRPRSTSIKPLVMLWCFVFVIIGYVGVQEEVQALTVHQLAKDIRRCNEIVFKANAARDRLRQEEDEIATEERYALGQWLTNMVQPPPDIAKLHTTDPLYQEWAVQQTIVWQGRMKEIEAKRENLQNQLRDNPLPEPKCGRE